MNFMESMENQMNQLPHNISYTENGAVGYRTSGKKLLDLNFSVSSLRSRDDVEIVKAFTRAFYENKLYAIKWLFFVSDIRYGMGERRLFKLCFSWLAQVYPEIAIALLKYVSEYSRWDNILPLLDNDNLRNYIVALIKDQLDNDYLNMQQNKPISLLAKWVPSVNSNSKETRKKALTIIKTLGINCAIYRTTLSELRRYLDVVEVKMCANNWDKINYEAVPSKANILYNGAFMKHDKKRRTHYLEQLEKGEAKINSSVCFPHDIVNKYRSKRMYNLYEKDAALEAMWKSLPDYVKDAENIISVIDTSYSMRIKISNKSDISAKDVAFALGIYFTERSSGQFKDKAILFSSTPRIIDFSSCNTLADKLTYLSTYNDCSNTYIQGVFELILNTAVANHMKQEDLPKTILIISDMEFDRGTKDDVNSALFDNLRRCFNDYGYVMPRLVFWNVCSRTNTIPITENEAGVTLISGFATPTINMVLSGKTDPYECLLEQINSERYQPIEDAIKEYL